MPSPSYWPIVAAFAATMVAGGLLVWQAHTIAGLTIIAAMGLLGMRSIYGWVFEPLEVESGSHGHEPTPTPATAGRSRTTRRTRGPGS